MSHVWKTAGGVTQCHAAKVCNPSADLVNIIPKIGCGLADKGNQNDEKV